MIEIPILYEDDSMIVIDKPAGVIVNKSDTAASQITVQDWVDKQFKTLNSSSQINSEADFYKRSGIVHRIDKETSGILLIAKTQQAFEDLQRQFKEHRVKKTYLALAHGQILPQEGEINVSVGRLPHNRMRFGVVPGGREAITKYKVIGLKHYGKELLSLVELYPETGRTHQIRVHLKYLGHPIFADELYAGRKTARNDRKLLPRLFLHAAKISFIHPHTKKEVNFECSLPKELNDFYERLE